MIQFYYIIKIQYFNSIIIIEYEVSSCQHHRETKNRLTFKCEEKVHGQHRQESPRSNIDYIHKITYIVKWKHKNLVCILNWLACPTSAMAKRIFTRHGQPPWVRFLGLS